MPPDRHELAREAKVVGLREFSTPSLEAVERRRWQLWMVAIIVMASLAAGLVLMASSGATSVGLFKHLPVRVCLVALTMGFALYVLEKEVHLRRLTRMLLDERVLTAALSNRLKELAALVTVGKAVNSVLDLTQVLDIILSSALELLSADGGSIMLLESPDELLAVCVRGNSHAEGARLKVGESIAGYVVQQQEALLISGPASTERFKNLVLQDAPVDSALSVPLINRDEILGVLNVHATADRTFTEYDLRALGLFAEHAAVSIANAHLYEAEKDHVTELLELDRMKSEFIATVSHELRTPLTSILGCVQTMQRRQLEPEVTTDFLDTIDRQSHRLLRLIEEVLDVQRSTTAPMLQTESVDLADVVRNVVRAQTALGREVAVRVTPGLRVEGDAEALERVLINLVDNAFVHGSAPVEIEASAEGDEGRIVRVSVLDRGPGVPASDVARVFERFSRGNAVTAPGMGLGLYLVKTLVERQGGHITVTGRPDGGASFNVGLAAPRSAAESVMHAVQRGQS
ncbi:MAG: GAF domain-containing protein [Acidimicrobiia bacterium]|nr:GAF domain-containing protein [Acidimicrobiia bacterium]